MVRGVNELSRQVEMEGWVRLSGRRKPEPHSGLRLIQFADCETYWHGTGSPGHGTSGGPYWNMYCTR